MPLLTGGYIEAITSCARLTSPCRNVTVTAQDTGMVVSPLHQEERRGETGGQVASAHVEAPEALQIHHVRVVNKEIYLHLQTDTCQNFGIK
jgi:nitrite reductase/ring-hydroxylating ferredoxin subunit